MQPTRDRYQRKEPIGRLRGRVQAVYKGGLARARRQLTAAVGGVCLHRLRALSFYLEHDVGSRQDRRQGPRQGQVALVARRPAVPGRPSAPSAAERPLCRARGRRRAGVPGGRAGVPHRRDPGAGGQRGPRQQEDAHHPAPPAAGHPQRRGAQQAAGRRDDRAGRRPAQYPGRAAAQEDQRHRGAQGAGGRQEGHPGLSGVLREPEPWPPSPPHTSTKALFRATTSLTERAEPLRAGPPRPRPTPFLCPRASFASPSLHGLWVNHGGRGHHGACPPRSFAGLVSVFDGPRGEAATPSRSLGLLLWRTAEMGLKAGVWCGWDKITNRNRFSPGCLLGRDWETRTGLWTEDLCSCRRRLAAGPSHSLFSPATHLTTRTPRYQHTSMKPCMD